MQPYLLPTFPTVALPDRPRVALHVIHGEHGAAVDLVRERENVQAEGIAVATGRFGADMAVALVNDGPVTIWLDTAS